MVETLSLANRMDIPSPSVSPRERLILAAERLFARSGIDAVPLREIARAAKNGNNNAVQYHFGTREGLLRAIFSYRIHQLNRLRSAILAEQDVGGQGPDLRGVVKAWLLPLALIVDEGGKHNYAAFMAHYVLTNISVDTALAVANTPAERASLSQFIDLIARALPHLPMPTLLERIQLTYLTFANMLVRHDNSVPHDSTDRLDASVRDTLECIVAYLSAPFPTGF